MLPRKQVFLLKIIFVSLALTKSLYAEDSGECFYVDTLGKTRVVSSIQYVPAKFRPEARCANTNHENFLANPDEISHQGLVRRENMSSSLGSIELSWPREVEKLFGRNPKLAVQDVSRAVSKALKSASFNNNIRLLDTNWKIVYLGKDLAASQIPEYLRMACHPGWMTPPTNIYIAAEKIATNCNTGSLSPEKANISMLETLAHEMGHVVEAAILGNGLSQDRQRAEGFATWFEVYVAKYSSLISDESLKRRIFSYAKEYMKRNNSFDGSAGAYGYASLDFFAIVDRRGVAGLMDVYNKMQNSGVSFSTAYSEVTGWSDNKIQKERERVLN